MVRPSQSTWIFCYNVATTQVRTTWSLHTDTPVKLSETTIPWRPKGTLHDTRITVSEAWVDRVGAHFPLVFSLYTLMEGPRASRWQPELFSSLTDPKFSFLLSTYLQRLGSVLLLLKYTRVLRSAPIWKPISKCDTIRGWHASITYFSEDNIFPLFLISLFCIYECYWMWTLTADTG